MWESDRFAQTTCENLLEQILAHVRHVRIWSSKLSYVLRANLGPSSKFSQREFARMTIKKRPSHLTIKFSHASLKICWRTSSFLDRHLLEWSFDSSRLVNWANSHILCENLLESRSKNDPKTIEPTCEDFDQHPHTHSTRDFRADQLENRLRWSNSQKLALLLLNRDYIVIESWLYIVSFTGLFYKRALFGDWKFPRVGSIVIESWLFCRYHFIVIRSLLFDR